MINEQATIALSSLVSIKHEELCKRKNHLYNELIELADLDNAELTGCVEENAEHAISVILKYGTCMDNAKAIKLYTKYLSINEILNI